MIVDGKETRNIKKKPWFLRVIPWLASNTAQSVYPNIYVPDHVYEDLVSEDPDPRFVALVKHEHEHLKSQKKIGLLKFIALFPLSSKFRLNEELGAIAEEMRYLKNKGLKFDIEKRARHLSGWIYLWMVEYERAKGILSKLWMDSG